MNLKSVTRLVVLAGLAIAPPEALGQRRFEPGFPMHSFERGLVPLAWSVTDGSRLSVSPRRYKHGRQSMRWDWRANSKLTVTEPNGLHEAGESRAGGILAWVYSEQPNDGCLTFRFGAAHERRDDNPHYTFRFGLDFRGWRALWVHFQEDAANEHYRGDGPLDVMEIVAPASPEAGTMFLDLVAFVPDMAWFRAADYQVPQVNKGRRDAWQGTYYWSQRRPIDPAPKTITAEEAHAFARIVDRYEKWVFGDGMDFSREPARTRYEALQQYIAQGKRAFERLNITADADTLRGVPLFASRSPHSPKFIEVFQDCMIPLAMDYRLNGDSDSREKILLLFDYIHDQGWAEGSGLGTLDHETLRSAGYMHAVCLTRDELRATGRLDRELATMRWYLNFGEVYQQPERPGANADRIRTSLLHMLLLVLCMENTPEKVRTMRNLVRWMDNACTIAPGWADTIKPDYTGFHHRGIYANAYAPHALHNAAYTYWLLHDTPFSLSTETRENLRQALLTARIMANVYDVPVGISGRMPFAAGILNRILPAYAYMALASEPVDREMAACFMRLWNPTSKEIRDELIPKCRAGIMYLDTLGSLQAMTRLAARGIRAETAPVGHWPLPYGALAIHRRYDWMVSFKGWSRYVWNYEGHSDENVFGRYVSFGAMQIIGSGNPVSDEASGYVHGGWDWNRWPGTTTINLPLGELGRDPKGDSRLFSDETFVGGVSLEGRNGIFAMKLHDTVNDESFRALKTYFCFESMVVCLGSGITNDDGQHLTETTVFQCRLPTPDSPIWIDSLSPVSDLPYSRDFSDDRPVWLTDPVGNGYFVRNARRLKVTRRHQTSTHERGWGKTEGDFATAWIEHGASPEDASYEYAVLVQSDLESVNRFARHPRYEIHRCDERAHIVRHGDTGVVGLVLFEASADLAYGALRSVDTPTIIMMRESDEEIVLGLADPDLRLTTDARFRGLRDIKGDLIYKASRPGAVRVTLAGRWRVGSPQSAVRLVDAAPARTTLEFCCRDGKTIEAVLERDR